MEGDYLFSAPEEIVAALKRWGMAFENESKAVSYLLNIGYHRLSAYLKPFIDESGLPFKRGTTFGKVMRLYRFDKKLRLLIFNELEKIEVAVRSVLTNYGCEHTRDVFWITNARYFADFQKFSSTLAMIDKELSSSREDYILNFYSENESSYPPAWMITEVLSFGSLNYIYSNIADNQLRKRIANYFGIKPQVLSSWLTALSNLRNVCCHHSRAWNRAFALHPAIPRHVRYPWINTDRLDIRRLYYRICIIRYFLHSISPANTFRQKIEALLCDFPMIDVRAMGFPRGWEAEPLWN